MPIPIKAIIFTTQNKITILAEQEIKLGTYSIFLGNNSLSRLNKFISERKDHSKMFLLADENSLKYCLPPLISNSPVLKTAEILEIESGEENKNIEVGTHLWSALSDLGADRKSLLINLGGGVITDMGGFIASTFKRGIDFINIPTTLLAQVDASLGGKTGIDLNNYKNEVGTFKDPLAVFIYPVFLKTLNRRHTLSGFAEVIKHALIADEKYWKNLQLFNIAASENWEQIILPSIEIKKNIVESDPFESGLRKSLNFGHTIGHAIESFYLEGQRGSLMHGEAVAVGMLAEAFISNKICGLKDSELDEIRIFLMSVYKTLKLDSFDDHRIIELMRHDKKNKNDEISFTLLSGIGKVKTDQQCSVELIKEALKYYRSEANLIK